MDSRHINAPNGPVSEISEQKLKTDAIDIAAKKSKLVHQVLEATISTGGDSRCMADIKEIVVTSTGQEGWCGECEKLKIDVANLYKKYDAWEKKFDALDIRFGLIDARDIISEIIVVFYGKIEFTHDGESIDFCRLREQYSKSPADMSILNELNEALLTSVAKILGKESLDECPEFDIICAFKADRNRDVHHRPSISEAKEAINFYCRNASQISFDKKEYTEKCFLLFAEKVCG
jgi:thiol-disulfide isomerase/thioredoxin